MSINRRTAIAVRSIGVASAAAALALGVAGNAFACNISEFTPSATCDNGKGAITVVDKDGSNTAVTITVTHGLDQVGQQEGVKGSAEGVTFTFPVDWQPGQTYDVHVVKTNGGQLVGDKEVKTGDTPCATPTTTPPTTPATTAPTTPATTPATTPPETTAPGATPSSTASSSAPAVADTNAPSPASGGSANLAETGGGSNTGMIAGIAAVLVAGGGGAVFMLRRRNPARH